MALALNICSWNFKGTLVMVFKLFLSISCSLWPLLVTNNKLASVDFLYFLGLLSMQWIAEAVTLNQALSQYGHPVQWWMTAELKVLSPLTFNVCTLLYFLFPSFAQLFPPSHNYKTLTIPNCLNCDYLK